MPPAEEIIVTREQALQEARRRGWTDPYAHKYSSDHVSGVGREYEVGEAINGRYVARGDGASWEEAFADADLRDRDVPQAH